LTIAAHGFKKDVIPLIHPFGGTKKAGKKKLVETITRNSLHNLTRKVAAQKATLIVSLVMRSILAANYWRIVASQPLNLEKPLHCHGFMPFF